MFSAVSSLYLSILYTYTVLLHTCCCTPASPLTRRRCARRRPARRRGASRRGDSARRASGRRGDCRPSDVIRRLLRCPQTGTSRVCARVKSGPSRTRSGSCGGRRRRSVNSSGEPSVTKHLPRTLLRHHRKHLPRTLLRHHRKHLLRLVFRRHRKHLPRTLQRRRRKHLPHLVHRYHRKHLSCLVQCRHRYPLQYR